MSLRRPLACETTTSIALVVTYRLYHRNTFYRSNFYACSRRYDHKNTHNCHGSGHKPLAGQAALSLWIQYRTLDRMPYTTYYSLMNMYRELDNRYVIRRPYVTRSTNRSLTAQRLQAWCTCSFEAFTCALVLPEASHESSLYKNLSFSLGPIVDY